MSVCRHDAACPGYGPKHNKAAEPQAIDWVSILTSARDSVAEKAMQIHEHITGPGGTRCVDCGATVQAGLR